jgi:predicted solute-binding protein
MPSDNINNGRIRIAIPVRLDAVLFEYGLAMDRGVDVTIAPVRDVPRLLHERAVDCALVPSVMYFQGDYLIVPDAAISTFMHMSTELLVSRLKLDEVRSVAFPRQPDTSRTILEIALRELFPEVPYRFEIGTGNPFSDLEKCDAAVVTGEGAFGLPNDLRKYDIGEFWVRLTELPAVFYLWLTPAELSETRRERAYAHIIKAKKTGLAQSDKVLRFAQNRITLNRYRLIEYLTVDIDYDLFSRQVKSLKALSDYMASYKLIKEGNQKGIEFASRRNHISIFEELLGKDEESADDVVQDWTTDVEEEDEELEDGSEE